MPSGLVAVLSAPRLRPYRRVLEDPPGHAPASSAAVASLYAWQVSLSAAWFETLAYTEAVVRSAVDRELRRWNQDQGRSQDWLEDTAAPVTALVARAAVSARARAEQATNRRLPPHPRSGAPVTLDDRVAQLDFGALVRLFPQTPPSDADGRPGRHNGRENLWRYALRAAFPDLASEPAPTRGLASVSAEVRDGYRVGQALERLRRLRNRVFHHEQTLHVAHPRRLADAELLVGGVRADAAASLRRLDAVRRCLALRPVP